MKYMLEGKLLIHRSIETWWKPLQRVLPDEVEEDIHGSKDFFYWFRKADLDLMGHRLWSSLHPLYIKLPYSIWNACETIYGSIFLYKKPNIPIIPEEKHA